MQVTHRVIESVSLYARDGSIRERVYYRIVREEGTIWRECATCPTRESAERICELLNRDASEADTTDEDDGG